MDNKVVKLSLHNHLYTNQDPTATITMNKNDSKRGYQSKRNYPVTNFPYYNNGNFDNIE